MNQHFSDTEFLHRMYGISPAGSDLGRDQHLASCKECRERWEQLQRMRQALLRHDEEITQELLSSQRRAIQQKIAPPQTPWFWRWTPAVAVLSMALAVFVWKEPSLRAPVGTEIATSDAQLMTDIYRTVYDSEPDVVEPLHALFDEGSKQ